MAIDKTKLTGVEKVYPLNVPPYEQYMGDFQNPSVVSKVNAMIQSLHQIGRLTNETVSQWNSVMKWIVEGGMDEIAETITNEKVSVALEEVMRMLDVSLDNGLKELAEKVSDEKIDELLESGQFESMISESLVEINEVVEGKLEGFNLQLADLTETSEILMFTKYSDLFPSEITNILPFSISLSANGELLHTFNIKEVYENPDITVFVDGSTGSDNDLYGDGTQEKPFKSMTKALTLINSTTWTKAVIQAKGEFRRTEQLSGATVPTGKTLCVVGDGNTLFYAGDKGAVKTWTVDGDAYKTSFSNAQNIVDRKLGVDSNGIHKTMKKVSTIALCQTTTNSWYTDGSNVWVNTYDKRQPDNDIFLLMYNAGFSFILEEGAVLLQKDFVRFGNLAPSGTNGKGRVINVGVKISGGGHTVQGDGIAAVDVKEVLSFNTIIAYCPKDGFNYHYANTSETERQNCYAFEYNCISYGNGTDAGDQASTMHEGVKIVRGNGKYSGLTGSAIVDVGNPNVVIVNTECKAVIGMAINVDNNLSHLTLINSIATTETAGQYSVKAYNAKFRNNIVKGDVSVANLTPV